MTDFNFFYSQLVPSEVNQLSKFNEELKIIYESAMTEGQKLNTVNYITDLVAALRSGLKWTDLSVVEQELVKKHCGDEFCAQFLVQE